MDLQMCELHCRFVRHGNKETYMKKCNIGCIGCGVMGGALIRAIAKVVPASDIYLFDTDAAKMESLAKELGANAAKNSCDVATKADYLLLAVKPAYVDSVLADITAVVPQNEMPLFVSIAAGVKLEKLKKAALTKARFVRLMPNIPALVGEAMIALTHESDVSADEVAEVKELLSKAGSVECVPENLMDCVTGVSGSGPAYGFVFIEALADAAVELLDHHAGEEGAGHGNPPGARGRQGHGQEQTGQHCGQVVDADRLFHQLPVAPLEEHGGSHGGHHHQQSGCAELDHSPDGCGAQRDKHVQHQAPGVGIGSDLRLIRYVKNDLFFLLAHFWASFAAAASAFAFSAAALAWNISLAVLNAWVRGILAGQLYAQLPHSKQSRM